MCATGANWLVPHGEDAIRWGADLWALTTSGQWWRLLTSAFVHFGLIHIAFNMWALYQAGQLTERLFGRWFFLLLYLYCAVMSGLTSIWWDRPDVCAGASGAIFGVFGALLAYLILHRKAFPVTVVQPLMKSTIAFIGYNIFFGLTQKNISNSAHIGGLISGFAIGLVIARPIDLAGRRRQFWPRFLAGIVVLVVTLAAAVHAIPKSPKIDLADLPAEDPVATLNRGVRSVNATPPDYATALSCFRRSAAAGLPEAMFDLALLYQQGHGTIKDQQKAIAWYEKAANAGSTDAMNNLGIIYAQGDGVKADPEQAARWFSSAAGAGQLAAAKVLSVMYVTGEIKGTDFDAVAAMQWFKKLADDNSKIAACAVGLLYDNGDGVAQNFREALSRYQSAASDECPQALTYLGRMFAQGHGVHTDPIKAVILYKKAADAGDALAMQLLADCYEKGSGVTKDPAKAAELRKAARTVDPFVGNP
jgi:TPR repeat protein/membrane associated rhomboid family serine protease